MITDDLAAADTEAKAVLEKIKAEGELKKKEEEEAAAAEPEDLVSQFYLT